MKKNSSAALSRADLSLYGFTNWLAVVPPVRGTSAGLGFGERSTGVAWNRGIVVTKLRLERPSKVTVLRAGSRRTGPRRVRDAMVVGEAE